MLIYCKAIEVSWLVTTLKCKVLETENNHFYDSEGGGLELFKCTFIYSWPGMSSTNGV